MENELEPIFRAIEKRRWQYFAISAVIAAFGIYWWLKGKNNFGGILVVIVGLAVAVWAFRKFNASELRRVLASSSQQVDGLYIGGTVMMRGGQPGARYYDLHITLADGREYEVPFNESKEKAEQALEVLHHRFPDAKVSYSQKQGSDG
jgi:hypothetical protein